MFVKTEKIPAVKDINFDIEKENFTIMGPLGVENNNIKNASD